MSENTEAGGLVDGKVEIAIDALRIQAFKTNSGADRQAYFDAASRWFQDRHYRQMEAATALASERAAHAETKARLAEALKALDLFEHYGCPVCHGDCSSANPPVDCCPTEAARRAREGGKVDG